MADAPNGSMQVTGTVMLFKRPEPLNRTSHGALGLRRSEAPLAFAREAHIVPVTVGEFSNAALNYPIIFGGEKKAPVAVMGLRVGENLFIGADGQLEREKYLPTFIRRYPFVLAQNSDDDSFVVCVDAGSDLVVENPDVPFFENGETSDFTNDAVEFLKNYERQRVVTQRLSEMFIAMDLFETKTVSYRPQGPDGTPADPVQIAEYFAVSMEKVNELPAEKLVEMRDNGALNAIYIHNLSLLNWRILLERALRQSAEATPIAQA